MRPLAALALLGCAALASATPAEKYPGPDDPATLAAARQALGHAKVLDVVGITRGIDGVLKDLRAKVTDREIRIELSADVLFDFDKYDLRPEASVSLGKVAEVLRASPDAPVSIEGHTDGKGTDAYNQPLSERRAQAVKAWLVEHGGAPGAKITTKGWGKTRPVAPNTRPDGSDDPEGRKKNRRVEITVLTR
jgi:outer membrane protein OmpA-like peptidoglycan-associated protein